MKKLFLVVMTFGLAAYLALPMPGQSAGRNLPGKIERKKRQVEKERHREGVLTQDISSYSTRIRGLQGDIRGYASREAKLQGSLQRKRAEVQRVQDRLEVAQDRLVRLRARLKEATDVLATRLVEIYKDDEPDVLTVILESDGFADMLDRTAFLERISKQDRAIVTRVRELKRQTKELTDQLGELEERKQAAVQSRIRAAQASAARSSGGGGGSANAPIKRGSGGLIWPVNGPVVSPFGQRWGRLHAGVDIAVPSGTPVHASQSGRVIIAGAVGGYGNYICIGHGGPLSTCYGHNSSLGVSQGQSVKQGQVIASSGCTGHCFGPHVHFETRINGSPVDPMGYL